MANHSSATVRRETSHVNRKTRTNTIMNALKERAQAILHDQPIDELSRAILRHALETNDPWLAEMVRRTDAEEASETNEDDSSREKIETLIGMICGAGGEASSALLVLMAMFQNSAEPNALANTAKHLAFTYCGELNVNGMVDAQAALFEGQLLARNRLTF
jgi:hypothetical protein